MGRNFKIAITLTILILFYGIYYFGTPAILNLPESKTLLEQIIEKESGFKISIENPRFSVGILPTLAFQSENFVILNDDKSKALEIVNPKLKIRILPLLLKHLSIKRFAAEKIDANLVFDGNLKLGQYDITKMPEPEFKLKRASINVDDYDVNLFDKIKNKKLKYDGNSLIVKNFIDGKKVDLSTSAILYSGMKTSEIKADLDLKLPLNKISEDQILISGYLKNFDLSDFSDYAKSISKNQIKSLSGIININAQTLYKKGEHKNIKTDISVKNLGIYKDSLKTSIYSKNEIKIISDILTINNGIDIKSMKISGKNVNGSVTGKITSLNNKLPNLDLNVVVKDTKAEDVIPLLPAEHDLVPDIDLYVLKQAGFWGDASANLQIKGKADYPNVYGDVIIKNAYMVKQIPNAQKATIKLLFKGGYFDLDVYVPTSPTQKVWVKGPINIDAEQAADLHITSTDTVDLKTAQIVLNPLHRILHFELGPVPIMDIKGQGGINLKVKGTKENPYAWGEFRFNKGTVSFLDIHNMEIHNASGVLKFDNQDTYFESYSGILNGSPISVKGTCSLLGIMNFDVFSQKQNLGKLLTTVQTSPMLKDIQELLKPIEYATGPANIRLNLSGTVKDVNDIVFNKNLFAKGSIELLSDAFKIKDVPISISGTSGVVNFNNFDADFDLKTNYGQSEIVTTGKIKENICDVKFSSKRFNIGEALKTLSLPNVNDFKTINTSFNGKYNGKIDEIEYEKIYLKGKIFSNIGSKSSIIVNNADYELSNSNFKLPNLKGTYNNSPYNLSLYISKMFSQNRVVSGYGKISSFNLSILNNKSLQKYLPKELSDIEFEKGNINITARAKNNNYNVYTALDGTSMFYKPDDIKLVINSGNVLLHNDTLNLNKINAKVGQMPIFLDGKVNNVLKNPTFNVYANIKPTQDFIEQIFNKNSIYPIKLKGDSIIASKITGNLKNINAKSTVDIKENSSFYYMGATIGDPENPVKIAIDSTLQGNRVKLNNLKYDKIILSQNNKPYVKTQMNASGTVSLLKDGVYGFDNFRIKTDNPTDAKVFNIIFRKPFMKQGVFTSDIILNGTSINPRILGKLNVTSIDIPFFDSTIRDINLDFKQDKINISSTGKVLTNDVVLDAVMKNRLTPPYVIDNVKLNMADLNINKITDMLRDIEAESARTLTLQQSSPAEMPDISQVLIRNADIKADKIQVRNINANNFSANLKITDKHLVDVDKFKFDIAQGSVVGNFKYDIVSNKTNLDIHLNDANAQIMSEALFDLKGQVYGSLDGHFNLACVGNSNDDCFKSLSGEGNFKISDGRMPKLGSLEYLLKAGNLIKSGFAGISINSLIDLVTPLKTGDFESIYGDIHISKGIADRVNVYSKGNDLNMYMTGSYNIVSSVADMKILGSLSKNITTVLGKIKNASLTTLFNTIPRISDSTEKLIMQEEIGKIPNIKDATDIYRIFAVEVNGDINGSDYVRSFKWVK